MEAPTFLLLVLCVGVAASSAVDLHKRIYGGHECKPDEHPYHVALATDSEGDDIICGGTLISDTWVLTAAHCRPLVMYAVFGVTPGPGTKFKYQRKIYQKSIFYRKHDIMLLKLSEPTNIKPVSLPTEVDCKNKPAVGQKVKIAGYGTYWVNKKGKKDYQPDRLLCVDMDVVDCVYSKKEKKRCLGMKHKHLFCGGNTGDVGPGDSGGGVVYNDKIYGIVLGGGDEPCITTPAFLDVCSHLDWINETISK